MLTRGVDLGKVRAWLVGIERDPGAELVEGRDHRAVVGYGIGERGIHDMGIRGGLSHAVLSILTACPE
jgi:hypothetical protein